MKKLLISVLLSFTLFGILNAQEQVLTTEENNTTITDEQFLELAEDEVVHKYDKNIRMDLTDCLFYNILSFGNDTKISFTAQFLNNVLGIGVGVKVAEALYLVDLENNVNPFHLILAPYVSLALFDGDLYFGLTPMITPASESSSDLKLLPYFGLQYTIPLNKVQKEGVTNNVTMRFGLEWYVDIPNFEETSTIGESLGGIAGTIMSTIIPKVFLGFGYRLGYYY